MSMLSRANSTVRVRMGGILHREPNRSLTVWSPPWWLRRQLTHESKVWRPCVPVLPGLTEIRDPGRMRPSSPRRFLPRVSRLIDQLPLA